jgi:hypothetical protein
MNIAELKIKIFRQVDSLDSNKLEEFYGLMLNYFNSKKDIDEWIGVTEDEKLGIEAAIKELDSGKGIPHTQVMHNLRKKYSHD